MDWAETTAWGYKKHLNFGIRFDLYQRFYGRLDVFVTKLSIEECPDYTMPTQTSSNFATAHFELFHSTQRDLF